MTRFNPAMTSAAAGEISPRLDGRDNLDQYFESLRDCENFVVTLQGGLLRRSGTEALVAAVDPTDNVRLIPFIVSTELAYVLELGDETMRPLADGVALSTIATPYSAAELDEVRTAQEAGRMYFVHPNHPVYVLRLGSEGGFGGDILTPLTFEELSYRKGQAPMLPPNDDENVTFEISGAGPTTYTLETVGFRDLTSADIGRYIRVGDGSTKHSFFKITAVADVDEATVTKLDNKVPATGAQTDWSISPLTDEKGFYTVAFHEGRLFYGGTPEAVDRVWASNSDDFDFFDPFGPDIANRRADEQDRSFSRRLVSGKVHRIRWMLSTSETLSIGTVSGEFSLMPDNDSILSNVSARVKPTTSVGSAPVEPVVADASAIFVQKDGEKLRRVVYSLADDRQRAQDLSVLAEHITRAGIFQMAYQQSPDSILWLVLADGNLVGVTLEQEQRVVAFHRHRLGGEYDGGHPFVVSVAVIPEDQRDTVYLAVRRTVAGDTLTTIERFYPAFRPDIGPRSTEAERVAAVKTGFFIDMGVRKEDPVGFLTVTAPLLEGLTVDGLIDGSPVYGLTFVTDTIAVPAGTKSVSLGLPYTSRAETQRFTGGTRLGTGQSLPTRTNRVDVRVLHTVGLSIAAANTADPDSPEFRETAYVMDEALPLFDGDVSVSPESEWTDTPTVTIVQDKPLPAHILSVYPRNTSNDR